MYNRHSDTRQPLSADEYHTVAIVSRLSGQFPEILVTDVNPPDPEDPKAKLKLPGGGPERGESNPFETVIRVLAEKTGILVSRERCTPVVVKPKPIKRLGGELGQHNQYFYFIDGFKESEAGLPTPYRFVPYREAMKQMYGPHYFVLKRGLKRIAAINEAYRQFLPHPRSKEGGEEAHPLAGEGVSIITFPALGIPLKSVASSRS